MTADQIFALGQQDFQKGDYDEAELAFNRLLLTFPNYGRAPEARFLLARTHFRKKEYVLAASEWRRFLDRFPSDSAAPSAALGICRANAALSPNPQRDQTYTEQALTVCQNAVKDYVGTPAADSAGAIVTEMRAKLATKLYDIGDYYYQRNLYDSAIIYFQMVDDQYGDTGVAPRAVLGIMNAYKKIGYDDLAKEARDRLLSTYPDSPEAKGLAASGTAESRGP